MSNVQRSKKRCQNHFDVLIFDRKIRHVSQQLPILQIELLERLGKFFSLLDVFSAW
jgi:hypothetical protein